MSTLKLVFIFIIPVFVGALFPKQSNAQDIGQIQTMQQQMPLPSTPGAISKQPRIEPNSTDANSINPVITALSDQVKATREQIDQMAIRLESTQKEVNGRINRIVNQVDSVDKKADTLDKRLAASESRVEALAKASANADSNRTGQSSSPSTQKPRSQPSKSRKVNHHPARVHHTPRAEVIVSAPDPGILDNENGKTTQGVNRP